jgi:hypothetical protein
MEAGRAQAADDRGLRILFVQVDALRVVGAGKGNDLLLGHMLAAERDHLANLEVLDVQLACIRVQSVLHVCAQFPVIWARCASTANEALRGEKAYEYQHVLRSTTRKGRLRISPMSPAFKNH